MTPITSILGRVPSLVDYMTGNTTGNSGASSTGISSINLTGTPDLASILGGGGDTLSLSPEAQALLAQARNPVGGTTAAADADGGKKARQEAFSFVMDFFKDSGVDLTDISAEAAKLLTGMRDLIEGMENVSQDKSFDAATKAYVAGQRESFTLQGEGVRLTATIQYADGKPARLTVTQLNGQTASTAAITLGTNDAGKPSTIEVARTEKTYGRFGGLLGVQAADPLSLAL